MPTAHIFIATSLDGFIARKSGAIDWLLARDDPNEDHGYHDFIEEIDAIVMGRRRFAETQLTKIANAPIFAGNAR